MSKKAVNKKSIIATSIAPVNIDNQRNAIDTWIRLGFDVISLNCKEEWEIIRNYFPDINFHIVDKDAREELGKPYVYFDSFMDFFKNSDYDICGIVNSDIYFFNLDESFKEYIAGEATGSLVYGSRMEINSLDNLSGVFYNKGFDYFFFDREFSHIYPATGLCIGQPAWDFWIIFEPIAKKLKVKKIINPIAYHISHKINWETQNISKFLRHIFFRQEVLCFNEFSRVQNFWEYSINFISIFNTYSEKIITYKRNDSLRVKVFYNGNPSSDSQTYKSLCSQSYKNKSIEVRKKEEVDIADVEEDLVCFIDERVVLDEEYLLLMVNSLGDRDCILCGISLKDNEGRFVENVYPVNIDTMEIDKSRFIDECVMYKTKVLQDAGVLDDAPNRMNRGFIGQGLVEVDYKEYVRKRILPYKKKRLYIFGAGGHTVNLLNQIDFSEFELCGIIDSNADLEGQTIQGYPVFYKGNIEKMEIDYILISSQSYEKEIFEDLKQSFNEEKLIRIYQI